MRLTLHHLNSNTTKIVILVEICKKYNHQSRHYEHLEISIQSIGHFNIDGDCIRKFLH